MGILAKMAHTLEDQVGLVHKEFEARVRSQLKEAGADWAELTSRPNKSHVRRTKLLVRALLIRTDATIEKLVGRLILKLEKVRRTLPCYA